MIFFLFLVLLFEIFGYWLRLQFQELNQGPEKSIPRAHVRLPSALVLLQNKKNEHTDPNISPWPLLSSSSDLDGGSIAGPTRDGAAWLLCEKALWWLGRLGRPISISCLCRFVVTHPIDDIPLHYIGVK